MTESHQQLASQPASQVGGVAHDVSLWQRDPVYIRTAFARNLTCGSFVDLSGVGGGAGSSEEINQWCADVSSHAFDLPMRRFVPAAEGRVVTVGKPDAMRAGDSVGPNVVSDT